MPDIVVMFFVLGLTAGLLRSDLKIPQATYETLSLLLMLTIGLKGGMVLHGNLLEHLSASYRRYLANFFIKAFGLVGTPLRIEVRVANNPYRP